VTAVAGALGAPAEAARVLSQARLVAAIGETTASALRSLGVRVDLVASAPSAETLAAEIATALRSSSSPEAR
jgi:uroporphyrinogen-III synthase